MFELLFGVIFVWGKELVLCGCVRMEVFSGSEFGGDGVGDCVYLDFWIFGVMVFSFGFGFGLCLVVWELEC